MNLNQFSPYKVIQLYELLASYRGRSENLFQSYPIHVKIDLTESCNHRCQFCFYNDEHRDIGIKRENITKGNQFIDLNILQTTLLDLAKGGTKAITLIGGGEPTLYPQFKSILRTLAGTNMEFGLVTNGARMMDDEFFDLLTNATWIRFSIDTLNPQTYLELHQPKNQTIDNLPHTLENLKTVISKRRKGMLIGASFLIHPLNYTEIIRFAEEMKKIGVDYVEYKPMYLSGLGDSQKSFFLGIHSTLEEVKKISDQNFKVIILMDRMSDNTFVTKDCSRCWVHFLTAHIGVDGRVYPCCVLAYADNRAYGNLNEVGFSDIWHGEKRREIIDFLSPHRCPRCWSDKTNELIEHILYDSDHPSFI